MGAGIVTLSLGQPFTIQGHCDLDLWPDDPQNNRFHLLVSPNLQVKFVGHRCRHCRVTLGQHFTIQGHCDLDLWPDDPQNKRGHLLVRPNFHIKFDDHRSTHC